MHHDEAHAASARGVRTRLRSVALACFASTGCNDITVEEVPIETCVSRRRWIGGDRGSPNMYPGRDCVGCHEDNDGPPLILAGTFYATREDDKQSRDCFGMEGVVIQIEAGDQQIFETTTNEAGNFWFAGRDIDIVMPYKVRTFYTNPMTGLEEAPIMNTEPRYGGCARCHSLNAPRLPGAEYNFRPSGPEYVNGIPAVGIPAATVDDFVAIGVVSD